LESPSSSEEGAGGGGGASRELLLQRAAAMRRNPTEPERRMWMGLRDSRLAGAKFRRQAVIGQRIVDFFCPAKGLAVEIDGDTHDPERDRERDRALLEHTGFRTLRFTNREVVHEWDGVLQTLLSVIEDLPDRWSGSATTPQPPPLKRRGSVAEALRTAAVQLAATSDTARLDAELLMAHALGCSRSDLLLRHMGDEEPAGFAALVDRRAGHEPVAYILGSQEFRGLDFAVNAAVLIPRADSECVVEAALEARSQARRVLDCGTGSGALLLAVLHDLPQAQGVGIDASPAALAVAIANASALDLGPRADMLLRDWTQTGWTADLGTFDLILANPPYVEDDAPLDASVRDHEPASALFAGPEGLDDYRVLIPQLPALLNPGGVAVLEIGSTQAHAVSAIAVASGFSATCRADLAGRPRALILRQ